MENKESQEVIENAMNNEVPEKKGGMAMVALQYGILTAIALIALTLFSYFAKLSAEKWIPYIGYAILLAGVVIGIKNYRDEHRGGFISYGNALGFGTLTIFFAALVTAIFTYFFYKFIAPDAMIPLKEAAEVQMLKTNPNMTDQEYDLAMKFVSPGFVSFGILFSYTLTGFVLALLASIVLKKKDPLEA